MDAINLFWSGGLVIMIPLSLILAGLIYSAYRRSKWIKFLGTFAPCLQLLYFLIGLIFSSKAVMNAPDISPMLFLGALRTSLISFAYAIIIFLLSRFLDTLVRKG